jgi:NhaP-type Na+/H+ or K+/H+ antiporter
MPDVLAFLIVVAGVLAVGVAVGILVVPALTRWSEREDEKPSDGSD